jgi:hypothetical protein
MHPRLVSDRRTAGHSSNRRAALGPGDSTRSEHTLFIPDATLAYSTACHSSTSSSRMLLSASTLDVRSLHAIDCRSMSPSPRCVSYHTLSSILLTLCGRRTLTALSRTRMLYCPSSCSSCSSSPRFLRDVLTESQRYGADNHRSSWRVLRNREERYWVRVRLFWDVINSHANFTQAKRPR